MFRLLALALLVHLFAGGDGEPATALGTDKNDREQRNDNSIPISDLGENGDGEKERLLPNEARPMASTYGTFPSGARSQPALRSRSQAGSIPNSTRTPFTKSYAARNKQMIKPEKRRGCPCPIQLDLPRLLSQASGLFKAMTSFAPEREQPTPQDKKPVLPSHPVKIPPSRIPPPLRSSSSVSSHSSLFTSSSSSSSSSSPSSSPPLSPTSPLSPLPPPRKAPSFPRPTRKTEDAHTKMRNISEMILMRSPKRANYDPNLLQMFRIAREECGKELGLPPPAVPSSTLTPADECARHMLEMALAEHDMEQARLAAPRSRL